MRKLLSLGIAGALIASSLVVAVTPATAASGRLVSVTALRTYPTWGDVDAALAADKFDPGTDRFGVRTYRLVYRTTDATGKPTTASGLVALPINGWRWLRTVSFGHGTEIFKGDAPSTSDDIFVIGPALTFASAGFAAVAPDYVGLGVGPGPHPWMDVPSETTASLDLLRAARDFTRTQGKQLTRDVYASGFSQGASTALGLARALQSGADPWFRAAAVAPISGAYDFRRAEIPALFTSEVHPVLASAYTSYLLVAFDRLHDIYPTPGYVFRKPYVGLAGLFDGNHTGEEVLGALPATIDDLLTPQGKALLLHPTGRFAEALAEADSVCTNWTPRMPVRLYYSPGDEQAVNANTDHCHTALAARGVRAPTVDLGVNTAYNGFVHEGSEVLGVPAATRWFAELSK
ncbi:lipase [Actinoplanes sp. Pm04-4]|uniref:Lipase n=1 Tax=Paractinoplanes pyxinae TaxID=2997416 RepID=A0ABT4BDD7_9ACTN|nr:lipase [Actinoplanes pyxinae]MCY1144530.1 lipase [Actinoplanes pyxinae]